MKCEWDENKNKYNLAKHGVSFETAKLVFEDPQHVSMQDRYEGGEHRWQTIGMVEDMVILLVAHSVYEEQEEAVIRIISARKATKRERQHYEQLN